MPTSVTGKRREPTTPTKCKYGDATCPCQDGDPCHDEGPDAFTRLPCGHPTACAEDGKCGWCATGELNRRNMLTAYDTQQRLIGERDLARKQSAEWSDAAECFKAERDKLAEDCAALRAELAAKGDSRPEAQG